MRSEKKNRKRNHVISESNVEQYADTLKMERLWIGVICNCVYGNEEENGVIDNVEGVRVLY